MIDRLFGKKFTRLWSILILFVVLTTSTSMSEILNKNKNQTGVLNNSMQPSLVKRVANWEKIAIYSILFIIASIGNTTSFIALLFMNRLNRSQNFSRIRMLFMNLCIADLMVGFFLFLDGFFGGLRIFRKRKTIFKIENNFQKMGNFFKNFFKPFKFLKKYIKEIKA